MPRVVRKLESLADISENGVYTVAEVAQILKRSEDAIRTDIQRGRIPAVRFEREYRIGGQALLKLFGHELRVYTQAELDQAVERAKTETRAAIMGELFDFVATQCDEDSMRMRRALRASLRR